MYVFRIENKSGSGPYIGKSTGVSRLLHFKHWNPHSYHTGCFYDFDKLDYKKVCGFESIYRCAKWFSGFFYQLHKCGYFLSVYEVAECDVDYSKSGHQIMFRKCFAKPVEKIELIGFRKKLKVLKEVYCVQQV